MVTFTSSRRRWLKTQIAALTGVGLGFPTLGHAALPEEEDWDESPAGQILHWLALLERQLTYTRYTAHTRVDIDRGVYEFDCSGMAAWVLWRAAPVAHNAVAWELPTRPLARDFYRRIRRSPSTHEFFGWQRVRRLVDARPGDVIAWLKPWYVTSPHTGHVAFVTETPTALPNSAQSYVLRVCDSSSMRHFDDTRPEDSDGFGFGSILVRVNAVHGTPEAYGWRGPSSRRMHETHIVIGRPRR